jgi:hypothetical protein
MNTQSDSEHALAAKIARLLDQGVGELDPALSAKLLVARKQALGHYKEQRAPAWAPAWAGGAVARVTEPHHFNFRMLAATVAFVVAFACALAWQSLTQGGSEMAEVDVGLLTDDLPINAYLDRGFDSWLKRQLP